MSGNARQTQLPLQIKEDFIIKLPKSVNNYRKGCKYAVSCL